MLPSIVGKLISIVYFFKVRNTSMNWAGGLRESVVYGPPTSKQHHRKYHFSWYLFLNGFNVIRIRVPS